MFQTRSQKQAQTAYSRVKRYGQPHPNYMSLAKKFPALIHTCGLAQAVAFAEAKGASRDGHENGPELEYLEDLAAVLNASGHGDIVSAKTLAKTTRCQDVGRYIRLRRNALLAASWLKRYVEALGGEQV